MEDCPISNVFNAFLCAIVSLNFWIYEIWIWDLLINFNGVVKLQSGVIFS